MADKGPFVLDFSNGKHALPQACKKAYNFHSQSVLRAFKLADAEEKYYADPKREMDLFKAQRAVQEARARRFARNVGAVGFGLD